MSIPGQFVDRSTPFTFTKQETTGWECPCGAIENLPAVDKDLKVIEKPLVTNVQWNGPVQVIYIFCMICGNRGHQSTLHQMVGVGGPNAPAEKGVR